MIELTSSVGVYRYYDLTIARADLAPDGVNKSMIVINGAFPGVSLAFCFPMRVPADERISQCCRLIG